MKNGFTLVEVIIAVFVLATIVVGLFGFISLILKSTTDGQRRIVATGLANEKMEMIRNLPYDSVGTVGGVPSGAIVSSEEIVRNGSTYTVETDIRYVDDAFDGLVTDDPADLLNTDYKQARVEVNWTSPVSERPVLLITQIAPSGVEGGDSLGTLVFQALNAAGAGVAGATVQLVNSSVNPAVNLTTSTNNEGLVTIPGLIPSSGTYELTVTKSGYTSEQTYNPTSTFTPDVDHSHSSALEAGLTNKTFYIDLVSSVTIETKDEIGDPIGNVAYSLVGTKKIGTNDLGESVYLFDEQDSTDASGVFSYEDMTWDTYSFLIDGLVTGYDIKETNVPLPLVLPPGNDTTLTAILVPYAPLTLHVTVLDAANTPIENATVQVTGAGYDQTLQTGQVGQAFFSPLLTAGDYSVTVDATGYGQVVQQVTVSGSEREHVIMSTL